MPPVRSRVDPRESHASRSHVGPRPVALTPGGPGLVVLVASCVGSSHSSLPLRRRTSTDGSRATTRPRASITRRATCRSRRLRSLSARASNRIDQDEASSVTDYTYLRLISSNGIVGTPRVRSASTSATAACSIRLPARRRQVPRRRSAQVDPLDAPSPSCAQDNRRARTIPGYGDALSGSEQPPTRRSSKTPDYFEAFATLSR